MRRKKFRCPKCGRSVSPEARFFPFCCERCRLIDLGKWLQGEYRIAGQKVDLETALNGDKEGKED